MLLTAENTTTSDPTDWLARADRIGAEIARRTAEHDAEDSFVVEAYDLLKADGFFKALVPVEFGGGGASVTDICQVIRRLGASCGSTALAFAMHSHLVAVAAWRLKHQNAPTDGLLKRVAAEDLILVSSGGSDWLASGGTAVKVEGGFRITARKAFSSGSPAGDLLMTSAVYEDPEAGPTVLHFGVSLKAPGVAVRDTWRVLGMRGTGSNDIELTEVFVPDASISGRRPAGPWHMLFHIISMIAFPIIYSAYAGVADGARARTLAMVGRKTPEVLTASLVGEMENTYATLDMAMARMIALAETGAPGPESTSAAMTYRTLIGRSAIATVERAMEAAGGQAFYRQAGLERAFRDVQGARFHPLQEKPQTVLTGRVALGWDIDA